MKTLIAYCSKSGCTAKCAELLAQALAGDVSLVNLAEENPDLDRYDGVILGGPIYAGSLPQPSKRFQAAHLQELQQKKLGLFICCGQVEKGQDQLAAAYLAELVQHASQSMSFGGGINLEKQNFLMRTMLKKVMKITESYEAIDRQAIAAFAEKWA